MSERPQAYEDLDEASADLQGPEDVEARNELLAELDAERAAALGAPAAKELLEMPDGTVETKDAVRAAQEQGQGGNATYDGSGRRA